MQRRQSPLEAYVPFAETPPFNFRPELIEAKQNAALVTLLEDEAKQELNLWDFSGLPDTSRAYYQEPETKKNEVVTSSPYAFPYLMEQAWNMINDTGQSISILAIRKDVEHEFQHAQAVRHVSRLFAIKFGVALLKFSLDDGKYGLQPFFRTAGCLRKIDMAYILSAPDELSDSDSSIIQALGYKSRDEIVSRRVDLGRRKTLAPKVINLTNLFLRELTKPLWTSRK